MNRKWFAVFAILAFILSVTSVYQYSSTCKRTQELLQNETDLFYQTVVDVSLAVKERNKELFVILLSGEQITAPFALESIQMGDATWCAMNNFEDLLKDLAFGKRQDYQEVEESLSRIINLLEPLRKNNNKTPSVIEDKMEEINQVLHGMGYVLR